MKNTLKNILLVLGAGLFLTSCEDMLDVKPKDRLTPDDYFKDENELQLYSNRFYNNILPGGATIYKEIGDNLIWSPLEDEISGQRTVPEEGGGYTFTALRQVNFFLENLDNCKDKKAIAKYRASPFSSGPIFISRKSGASETSLGSTTFPPRTMRTSTSPVIPAMW